MFWYKPFVFVAALVAAGVAAAQAPPLEQMDVVLRSIPDGPVAKVNGENIPRAEFARLYQAELLRATQLSEGNVVPDDARVQIGMWALGNLIEDELLYQQAKTEKLAVSRPELETGWQEQLKQFGVGQEGLTEAKVLEELGADSREAVLSEMERVLLIEQMRRKIMEQNNVTVSDSDIAQVFNEQRQSFARPETIHLRQIFIRAPSEGLRAEQMRQDARKRAEEMLGRIQAGQLFEGVMRSVAEAGGKDTGGELGPVPIDRLPPFLLEPALKLEAGKVSGIIESPHGFHIIQLVDLTPGAEPKLEDAAPFIRRGLEAQRGEQVVREYCDNLIQTTAQVRVFLELEKNLSLDALLREQFSSAQ